jgi:hypothetical protein
VPRRQSDRLYLKANGELATHAAVRASGNSTAMLLKALPPGEVVLARGDVRAQALPAQCDIKDGLALKTGLVCGKRGVIAIKGGNNGRWCGSDNYAGQVRCDRSAQGAWEVFQAVSTGGIREWNHLGAVKSGKMCAASPDTANPYDAYISCNNDTPSVANTFRFTWILCGKEGERQPIGWSIASRAGKLCADDWDSALRCDRGTLNNWEVHSVFCWSISAQKWQDCFACP